MKFGAKNHERNSEVPSVTPCNFGKSIPLMVKLVMLLAAVSNISDSISNTEECEKGSLWGAERQTRHKPDYEQAEDAETPCPWWSLAPADAPNPAI